MSVFHNNMLSGSSGSTPAASYQIQRSLRFNSSDSAYLSRTPGSAGNRRTWTFSCWVKRCAISPQTGLFAAGTNSNNISVIYLDNGGKLWYYDLVSGAFSTRVEASAVFRDFSAWYHIVVAVDTTQATAANRVRLYVNGSELTAFTTATYPSQNFDTQINTTTVHTSNKESDFYANYGNHYLAECHFIDGQQLTPSSFAETNTTTGQWQPKAYTGTYGTNGFKLDFADNSAATAAALGKDTSGNGNNWTPVNLSVTQLSSTTFVTAGTTAASGGTIANGGTPFWIDVLPTNASLAYSGAMTNVHDGNLSTYTYWVGDEYTVGNVMRARLDLRSFTSVTSVRVYVRNFGAGYFDYTASLLDAAKTTIAGTSVALNVTSAQWMSIPVSGTPRYLEFSTTSGGARRLELYEIEVNGTQLVNNTNLSAGNDSLVDTPTSYGTDTGAGGEVRGNYCTLNPLAIGANSSQITYANGNLEATWATTASYATTLGTIGVSSGKWYWETTITATSNLLGIATASSSLANYVGGEATSYGYYSINGAKYNNATTTAYGDSYTTNDVIGVALDLDNGRLFFSKNGVWQNSGSPTGGTGAAFTGLSGTFFPAYSEGALSSAASYAVNFGQRPFAYTAPSGFKALCDTNLPAPVVAKPSTVMDVKLYTGNGTSQTISGLGFSPDLVWCKARSAAQNHNLSDTVRGTASQLFSNRTDAETTLTDAITAFTTDGFSLGANASGFGGVNVNSTTYAAWCWDAGSSNVVNTQGSITSTVRANPSAGFSVVTYTGTGAVGTVGHGLGVAPQFFIFKARGAASDWIVVHKDITDPWNNYCLRLNSTGAIFGSIGTFDNTAPTSTVFKVSTTGTTPIGGAYNMLAYCFASVAGYSAFGSYIGNGSADGPFVYTGFRPRWVMIKATSGATQWFIYDAARSPGNISDLTLLANSSAGGNTYEGMTVSLPIDILSNGFKLRYADTGGYTNFSTWNYVYAAFAESPFQYARAR